MQNALIDAARKGIDVRILTNSYETGQELAMSLCHYISLNYYRDLLAAGVRIYEYGCDPNLKQKPYYHVKQFIIDGKCVAVGSYNLSLRSAYLESEIIKRGDFVEGLTGEVESRPILVNVIADHVDNNGNSFIRGDKFYLLTYRGEGFFKAWFGGKLFDMDAVGVKDAFEYYSRDPFWALTSQRYKHVWWKKIKTRQDIIGWTKEDVFSNQDACG